MSAASARSPARKIRIPGAPGACNWDSNWSSKRFIMSTCRKGDASRLPFLAYALTTVRVFSVVILSAATRFFTYDEVRPVLAELRDIVPAPLVVADASVAPAAWNAWIAARDRDIRERLVLGDEDTIVNWLMFGTTFTTRPRVLDAAPADAADLLIGRAGDLVGALAAPGRDEQ